MHILVKMLLLLSAASAARQGPASWSTTYSVQGTLYIPYAEVEEPFAAFYDGGAGKSRIDYYGGMDKTFQRGDQGKYGVAYKVVPMTDENVENVINCFVVNGTSAEEAVTAQSVLPDLDGFALKGLDVFHGQECEKWVKEEAIGDKVNKYTMWLRVVKSHLFPAAGFLIPVHYEMKGYNSLLGSHYDHYYLTYDNFSPDSPPSEVFDEYSSQGTCHGWPGPGGGSIYTMNPMKEFANSHTAHVDRAFEEFKRDHAKEYKSDKDHATRKDIFRQNQRYIHSGNRQGLSFKMSSNHMADWTTAELKSLRGRLHTSGYNGGARFTYSEAELRDAPDTLDWRLYGAVTPVKDQSVCGSCWSFGTVGTLEGAMFLQTGKLTRLSQQALIDCSWGFGNNGCDGGEDFRVYQYLLRHGGIPTEEDYGPYLGNDGYCHVKDTRPAFQISGYVNVTSGDNAALKVAIAKHGPVSVGIDASHKSLSFYSRGVYFEPSCNNTVDGLDHAVLAVGYGEIGGQDYWLIKNSWSTYWGNDGYVLMSQKDNNCGVATAATYVIPK